MLISLFSNASFSLLGILARLLDFSNCHFLQMCCQGRISPRPRRNAACCGTQGYNQDLRVSLSKKNRLCLL